MPHFRKRPVVIEARQYTEASETVQRDLLAWINVDPLAQKLLSAGRPGHGLVVPTLEGNMIANVGDWIICGVHGEFYPCKPDIFAATYEAVEEPADPA